MRIFSMPCRRAWIWRLTVHAFDGKQRSIPCILTAVMISYHNLRQEELVRVPRG
jgi:hypothetical protein